MADVTPGEGQGANSQGAGISGEDFQVTFDEGQGAGQDISPEGQGTGQDTSPEGQEELSNTFDWVPESFRETYINDETLKKYTTQDDFIKAMLEDRATNGESIKLPAADASDEEWNKVYEKLGRPTTPEGYGLSKELPEGLDFDEQMYTEFTGNIHKLGLSKKQATEIYNWYNNKCAALQKDISAQIEANYRQSIDTAVVALKKEWGTDYQENLNKAVAMANKFLSPETKKYLNVSKLGNNPLLIKDFYTMSLKVGEGQMRGGNGNPPGNTDSLAELNAKMEANLRAPDYTTNVKLQQENKNIAEKIAQIQSKG